MSDSPDAWAVAAASLPLAFAQVREDPRLDLELARALPPGATVVMIASGGDTAACLGRLPLRLHLVDMNPAQLALARLKWHLAGHAPADEAAALLGHLPMPARAAALDEVCGRLSLDGGVFGPPDLVAEAGPDHAGRYEIAFAELRRELEPWRREIDGMLASGVPAIIGRDSLPGAAMDAAFAKVMTLPNLVCLFGEEATRNPRRPFAEHFAGRTREVIGRLPPASNPFLWQILAGRFPAGGRFDWLQPDAKGGVPLAAEPVWHCGRMDAVLDGMPAASAELVHLSNILDWLSPEQAVATLRSARRVLRPGGRLILRQLNSTLEIGRLAAGLRWDIALGAGMAARDRSYFYPGILVGCRK